MKNKIRLFTLIVLVSTYSFSQNLPKPTPPFNGKIETTYKTSKPDFPQPVTPPAGAPNVLLILVDDLGFGGTEPFGGLIATPNIDRLAKKGLLYNRFHTTALCSPTRAALLTGRNHHQSGNAGITEGSTGYPGYDSFWGQENAAIPEILKDNGYNTAAFGKWHNTPDWETSPLGPFDRWPTGKGFERFYGFIGGETNQYYPQLYQNIQPIEKGITQDPNYLLTPDITNEAISWLGNQNSISPDKPWFLYFAPGAMHSPHHAPKEYVDRFKGKFDMGWDKFREEVYANQIKKGIIPANTKLTPRPVEMPAWESLSADDKKVYARQMETFAGFLTHLDENIGRLLDAVENSPNADNTMIIAILGDNGCSPEGGLQGTINNMATQNGFPDDMSAMLKANAELGGPEHENNFSACWAWAVDAPFQWTKEVASHLGGTRNGMIISWPKKFKGNPEIRSQFYHVVDIAPTIYDAAGIKMPEFVQGIKQIPLVGTSIVPTFSNSKAPETHLTQYFEIFGNRAIYDKGWIATARHGLPWVLVGKKGDFENDKWELYNIENDFSEANDLSSQNPEKLKELQNLFDVQAKQNEVYPLDDRFAERAIVPERPSVTKGKSDFTYYAGAVRIPEGSAPNIKAKSHTITAKIEISNSDKAQGVIVAAGGSGGYSFFIKDGYLMYENNFFSKQRDVLKSSEKLPKGKVTVSFEYTHTGTKYGEGGSARLLINGKEVAKGIFAHVPPARYSATETFDIGEDTGEPASTQYKNNFPFNGKIESVNFKILPATVNKEVETKTKEQQKKAKKAIE